MRSNNSIWKKFLAVVGLVVAAIGTLGEEAARHESDEPAPNPEQVVRTDRPVRVTTQRVIRKALNAALSTVGALAVRLLRPLCAAGRHEICFDARCGCECHGGPSTHVG